MRILRRSSGATAVRELDLSVKGFFFREREREGGRKRRAAVREGEAARFFCSFQDKLNLQRPKRSLFLSQRFPKVDLEKKTMFNTAAHREADDPSERQVGGAHSEA